MENPGSKQQEDEFSTRHSRSPFDLIVNQMWRSKSFAERWPQSSMSRFFKLSENSNKAVCISEKRELGKASLDSEKKENTSEISDELKSMDLECSTGRWGQVVEFMERLGKNPNHKSMNLNNSQLTANDAVQLAALLPNLPNLEELDLSWNELIGGTLKLLANHLQHMSQLKVLVLGSCSLSEQDVSALGDCIQLLPNIEEIDLSWNSDLGGNLSVFTQKLKPDCKLKILKLVDCNLTAEDGRALGQALSVTTRLEVLDLSMNKDVGSGLDILFQELKHVPHLQVLKLHLCGLTWDNIHDLGDALEHIPGVKKMVFSCNDIGGGFKETAAHLLNFTQLQVFDVHRCSLTEDDVSALTQIIPLLSSLQVLNLALNKKIGNCVRHLIARLRFLPRLKSLIVNNCNLTKESIVELGDTIPNLTELEILDLSWNKCLSGNLGVLVRMLQNKTHIRVLKLSSCNLTGQDLASLAGTGAMFVHVLSVCEEQLAVNCQSLETGAFAMAMSLPIRVHLPTNQQTLLMQLSVSCAGFLESLEKLDLTYNNTADDLAWAMFFQEISGLEELSELDISLRPLTHRECSPWITILLDSLTRLPSLTEFGMHRWVFSASQQELLDTFNKDNKRNIQFSY